jgi:hypothetical protein
MLALLAGGGASTRLKYVAIVTGFMEARGNEYIVANTRILGLDHLPRMGIGSRRLPPRLRHASQYKRQRIIQLQLSQAYRLEHQRCVIHCEGHLHPLSLGNDASFCCRLFLRCQASRCASEVIFLIIILHSSDIHLP